MKLYNLNFFKIPVSNYSTLSYHLLSYFPKIYIKFCTSHLPPTLIVTYNISTPMFTFKNLKPFLVSLISLFPSPVSVTLVTS